MINSREDREAQERGSLIPAASFSDVATRQHSEAPDLLRTAFQRDRDRILHSKAFRRLSHKTQVFLEPEGDHYRTRMTHTLEVSQIARSAAVALRLNADLTEAIALGHDLGHTPYGHAGEQAFNDCLRELSAQPGYSGPLHFYHNEQSLRIVDLIENEGRGLNLTDQVRDGILCHTGCQASSSLEGQVVAIADRIAYVNHDIDDALRAGIINIHDLPQQSLDLLGHRHSERITTLINDLVQTSSQSIVQGSGQACDQVTSQASNQSPKQFSSQNPGQTLGQSGKIRMSDPTWAALMELREFLTENVYQAGDAKAEEPKAFYLVKRLFEYYMGHPAAIPEDYRNLSCSETGSRTGASEVFPVIDYVSGMTDRFASKCFTELFIPANWRDI
jgi:dGTPase